MSRFRVKAFSKGHVSGLMTPLRLNQNIFVWTTGNHAKLTSLHYRDSPAASTHGMDASGSAWPCCWQPRGNGLELCTRLSVTFFSL
jgi:hypothetical protein